jgi:hypothetical protein
VPTCERMGFGRMLAPVAASHSPVGPDFGERVAKCAVLALLIGLMWGTLLGGVRIVTVLAGWVFH